MGLPAISLGSEEPAESDEEYQGAAAPIAGLRQALLAEALTRGLVEQGHLLNRALTRLHFWLGFWPYSMWRTSKKGTIFLLSLRA